MISIAYKVGGTEGEEDIERIAKKSGYTAVKCEGGKGWVVYDLQKNKVGGRSKKVPKEQIEKMKGEGLSMKQIAVELNISRASLYNYVKSYKEMEKSGP